MDSKYTPDPVTKLEPNEIFVFGSNEAGRHGAGAAYAALKWGAIYGQGHGLYGQTYALPTKDSGMHTLSLENIAKYVEILYQVVKDKSNLTFLITKIGCGLAGYTPGQIAPLFTKFKELKNVILPEEF